ncbi:hypothetical protein QR680_003572 [Steinernema hermaphroditum]|uniref:Uncharacterized protein n=1 Tax=Steinernema hermaphroditum TaxID=289476 RepID=A0AA39HM75_9BILA|nr:hypothetical protein QR680_003572 [Steinernema hermaphroditum]
MTTERGIYVELIEASRKSKKYAVKLTPNANERDMTLIDHCDHCRLSQAGNADSGDRKDTETAPGTSPSAFLSQRAVELSWPIMDILQLLLQSHRSTCGFVIKKEDYTTNSVPGLLFSNCCTDILPTNFSIMHHNAAIQRGNVLDMCRDSSEIRDVFRKYFFDLRAQQFRRTSAGGHGDP